MASEERNDRFTSLEERYAGFQVNDRNGEKIGKVDDLFVDERNEPEYVGVKMGFLGMSSTLIPMDIARVDEDDQTITVSTDKATAKDGPSFDDDKEITSEYENEVRSYYGLGAAEGSSDRGGYGDYYGDDDHDDSDSGRVGPGMAMGDTDSGEFRGHSEGDEGVNQRSGSDLEDEDELGVQRSEEELRAGTREREAGGVNVRKRVRTEREQLRVPKKREEVSVDRVPVEEGTASAGEIGDDEIRVPVTEEEVIVDKKPVVKEEIRVRKDVVEDEEVIEEDVRKEEVEIDDETERRDR
ncbi:MAG: DUF2382 domain-containing protein [Rubrobacteraceae bacterium]